LQLTKVQADTGKALSQLQEQQALLQQDLAEKARVLAEKDSALAQAEAFKTKVKVLADFPRLGKLAHMIPETADEAAVRQACTELDKTVAEMIEQEVQGHVKQMAAGFTPGPAAVPTATSEFPYQTDEQWGKALFEASRNASLADYKKLDTAYTKWRQLRAKP
jgi:plasmid stabilization system protein ParE